MNCREASRAMSETERGGYRPQGLRLPTLLSLIRGNDG